MALGRPLNILSSLDEAEEWHKQPYICGLPKKFKPFGLEPPYLRSRNNSPGPPWIMLLKNSLYIMYLLSEIEIQ